ncbi:hypothetical protein RCL_jg19629.t1 [Rhizophagus clarus]|uniref:Uncharacterized protein n=1 Tax=Rhizophagus clarus TaxID=94130 RepID=A0A8H3QW60_9GLOM|nr:hypothetical protein RCL_jg19629.t1 [Rhizophagus clarus]
MDNSLSRRDTTIDPNKCIGFASNLPRSMVVGSLKLTPSETFSTANSRTAFGTEGTVFFGIGDQMAPPSTFSIYWLNPEIGVNNYIVTISNTSLYSYHNLDPGEGNNAVYQVIISAIPSA